MDEWTRNDKRCYHALFSADLRAQVLNATGIKRIPRTPSSLTRFQKLARAQPGDIRPFCDFLFSVVSETLISKSISRIPRDPQVHGTVRDLIADHARDEAAHAALFSEMLTWLWPRLTSQQRAAAGELLPRFILQFLWPDTGSSLDAVRSIGLPLDTATRVVRESYSRSSIVEGIKEQARPTLVACRRAGVLDDAATARRFQRLGLIG